MSMSGNNLAVADIGGSKIYTFNTNGMIESINTALPVLQISVSRQDMWLQCLRTRM